MKTTVHDTVQRPWGYETLTTTLDDGGGVFNDCIFHKTIPGKKEITIKAINIVLARKIEKIKELDKGPALVVEPAPVIDKPLSNDAKAAIAKVTTEAEAAIAKAEAELGKG